MYFATVSIYPLIVNSAATKYSPATPVKTPFVLLLRAENRLTLYGAYVINIAWKESMLDHYLPLRKNIFAT